MKPISGQRKSASIFKRTVITILMSLAAIFVHAKSYRFYDCDKLTSSQINCIEQDRYGLLWIGTEYGLNRFDGFLFDNMIHDKNSEGSLPGNIVVSMLCDNAGNLWIGTDAGLALYDYPTGLFKKIPADVRGGVFRCNSICCTQDGELLVGTAGKGLLKLDKEKNELVRVSDIPECHDKEYFSRLYIDRHGYMWRSSHLPEFTMFILKNGKLTSATDYSSPYGAPVSFLERDGKMIIVCQSGILSYDYSHGTINDNEYDISLLDKGVILRRALCDHAGNIYLGTRDSGIYIIESHSKTLSKPDFKASCRFANFHVNAFAEDSSHNLWIGCYHKGLLLLADRQDSFTHMSTTRNKTDGGNCVLSLTEGEDGQLWCVVENDCVYKTGDSVRKLSRLNAPPDTRNISRDRSGRLWLCTENDVYQYFPATDTYAERLSLTGTGFNVIVSDDKGNLYFSNNGMGLVVYNVAAKTTKTYSMNDPDIPGHEWLNDWIQSMEIDSEGMLWLGTYDGLECFDTAGQRFVRLSDDSDKKPFAGMPCTALSKLSIDEVMVCTDRGIFTFDKTNGKTNRLDGTSTQLDGINFCAALTDNRGDIWLSSSSGIWHYDRVARKIKHYLIGNGLVTKEYINNSAYHFPNDRMAFGSVNGITSFYPEEVRKNQELPSSIVLTKAIAHGVVLDFTSTHFEVEPEDNSIELQFSNLDFKNAGSVSFQWRLNSGDWKTTPVNTNTVSLNQLSRGTHILEVRSVSNDDSYSDILPITIKVRTPWYATIWAYIGYIIFFMLTAAIAAAYIIQHKNHESQRKRMKFFEKAIPEINTPLTMILNPLRNLQKRAKDNGWSADGYTGGDLSAIDYNTHRLIRMVELILANRAEPDPHDSEAELDYEDISEPSTIQDSAKSEKKKSADSKPRVLIVDDDPKMGCYLTEQLSDWYYTEYVCDGNDAIRKLLSESFSIVVADMNMPKMDGISLLSNIRGNARIRDIPVILLSSTPGSDDRLKGLKKGSDGFLTKPFNIEELHVLIANRIRSVRSVKMKYTADKYLDDPIPGPEASGNDEKLMERINKALGTHLNDPDYTTEMLSSEVGVSRSQLHRKMIELTGMTTSEYIRNIRLKHAAELLGKGDMNVSQVAYQCGFANPGHFATVFKKQFGQSPKEFVRNSSSENKVASPSPQI